MSAVLSGLKLGQLGKNAAPLAGCAEKGEEAAACVEELTHERSPATVKQHLAALRMRFDRLVVG